MNSTIALIKLMPSWNNFLVAHLKSFHTMWNQHCKNKKFDDALLYVGVNDLNDVSQDSVQKSYWNLKQIDLKCKSAAVKRILIFGIVINNKVANVYISSVNKCISNMCRDNSFVFIGNNFPHQVSFAMVYTYLISENVF